MSVITCCISLSDKPTAHAGGGEEFAGISFTESATCSSFCDPVLICSHRCVEIMYAGT